MGHRATTHGVGLRWPAVQAAAVACWQWSAPAGQRVCGRGGGGAAGIEAGRHAQAGQPRPTGHTLCARGEPRGPAGPSSTTLVASLDPKQPPSLRRDPPPLPCPSAPPPGPPAPPPPLGTPQFPPFPPGAPAPAGPFPPPPPPCGCGCVCVRVRGCGAYLGLWRTASRHVQQRQQRARQLRVVHACTHVHAHARACTPCMGGRRHVGVGVPCTQHTRHSRGNGGGVVRVVLPLPFEHAARPARARGRADPRPTWVGMGAARERSWACTSTWRLYSSTGHCCTAVQHRFSADGTGTTSCTRIFTCCLVVEQQQQPVEAAHPREAAGDGSGHGGRRGAVRSRGSRHEAQEHLPATGSGRAGGRAIRS